MRIVANESPYDTRAVRRVLQAVARAYLRREGKLDYWPSLRVQLLERRVQRIRVEGVSSLIKIYLPPLQGTEFVGLARQQHGGAVTLDENHAGLSSLRLALQVQSMLYSLRGGRRRQWHGQTLLGGERGTLRGIPPLIPLRVIKSAVPRDKLRDKLARTMVLQKGWQRKSKLAATKLKKLSGLQKRYEKQLAQREAV